MHLTALMSMLVNTTDCSDVQLEVLDLLVLVQNVVLHLILSAAHVATAHVQTHLLESVSSVTPGSQKS